MTPYCYDVGYSYPNAVEVGTLADIYFAEECQAVCASWANCTHFSLNTATPSCMLLASGPRSGWNGDSWDDPSSSDEGSPDSDYTSGPKSCFDRNVNANLAKPGTVKST